MANRTFVEMNMTLMKRVVNLYPVVSVGAAGAVTLQKRQFSAPGAGGVAAKFSLVAAPTTGVGYALSNGEGVRTVVRTAAGLWTMTLSDPYVCLLQISAMVQNATGLFTGVIPGILNSSNVQANVGVGNGGVINLAINNGSGVATDPASGDLIYFNITLADGSEP
jgi:hypothetical protein